MVQTWEILFLFLSFCSRHIDLIAKKDDLSQLILS